MSGTTTERSWFAVDGALEPIAFDGPSFFRFPEAVAEHVIARYTRPGDWVLDPFCGFATTLVVAERLGRHAIGFEIDAERAAFGAARAVAPSRALHVQAEQAEPGSWPACGLLLTSPPYGSFRDEDAIDDPSTYAGDARRLFKSFVRFLAPHATIAVEVSHVREGARTRPLTWILGEALGGLFDFREEIVRLNTGPAEAGPGYDHSHILVFTLR